jgi:hypothetical protein
MLLRRSERGRKGGGSCDGESEFQSGVAAEVTVAVGSPDGGKLGRGGFRNSWIG